MSEFDRTGNFRRSIRRPRAPKPPESPATTDTNKLRNYSVQNQNSIETRTNNVTRNNTKSSHNYNGGDSSTNFDFNVIQNYINKLEFNVLMKKKSNERDLDRDNDMSTKFNKDSIVESNFVRGGANRTSALNHSTSKYDKDVAKKPILRTRSDTDKVEVVRKQMLLKSAQHKNIHSDVNSLLKQVNSD